MKFLLLILIPLTLHGKVDQRTWSINKDHSELSFSVDYLSVSTITGRFEKYWGRLQFDEDRILPNKIVFFAHANSINTGSDMRDGHLRSKDFFNIKEYPAIKFQSDKIEALEPGWFLAHGKLNIKDVVKNKSIKVHISEEINDTWGFKSKFVKFKFSLNRESFKLDWNKGLKGNELLVGKNVEISGIFQIQPVNKKTPPSKHMIPNTNYSKLKDKLVLGKISQEEFSNKTSLTKISVQKAKTSQAVKNTSHTVITDKPQNDLFKQMALLIMRMFGFFALWVGVVMLKKQIKKDLVFKLLISTYALIYIWAFWLVEWV